MIIGEPITGQEKRGTLTEPAEALARFYRAFNSRDLALMEENWDPSEETAMANPLGGIKRGWLEIREVYRRIFESRAKVRVEFHDYTLTVSGRSGATVASPRPSPPHSNWRSARPASFGG